jgi:hypothetical protein
MNPMVESAWIAAGAAAVGVIGTATVGIVGYFIARSTNREAIAAAKATTDKTIASARAENKSTIEAADASVHRTLEATREGQIIELYSRAVDQLGSEQLHVRIGGIYALERVARDSEKDHPIVMDVLTAFIREYSREQWPPQDRGERERWTRPDVQAAVSVVGRRDAERDTERIDLYGAILIRADLRGADFRDATFRGADLTRADLANARLVGADLRDVTLDHARLLNVDLTGAMWSEDKSAPEGWKLRTGSILLDPVGR